MPTKDEVARNLIDWHFKIDPDIAEIYRFFSDENEDDSKEPIKLLEVSDSTISTGRVDVFGFASAGDTPYPCMFALVTPSEMQEILSHTIPLPQGWELTRSVHFDNKGYIRNGKR